MSKLLIVDNQVKQNVIEKFNNTKNSNVYLLEYDSKIQNTPEKFIEFLQKNMKDKLYINVGWVFHGYKKKNNTFAYYSLFDNSQYFIEYKKIDKDRNIIEFEKDFKKIQYWVNILKEIKKYIIDPKRIDLFLCNLFKNPYKDIFLFLEKSSGINLTGSDNIVGNSSYIVADWIQESESYPIDLLPIYFKTEPTDITFHDCDTCWSYCHYSEWGDWDNYCTACPAGRFAQGGSNSGANWNQQCYGVCPVGKYHGGGGWDCHFCLRGRYQPNTEQADCIDCAKGTYDAFPVAIARTGLTYCTNCESGKYQTEKKKDFCTACTSGKYNKNGNTGATSLNHACTDMCGYGKFVTDYSMTGECISCSSGRYTYYQIFDSYGTGALGGGICLGCGPGQYSSGEASVSCGPCPIGHVNHTTIYVDSCVQCVNGLWQPNTGQTECNLKCPAGKSLNTYEILSEDYTIPGGIVYGNIIHADERYRLSTKCVQCLPGKYQSSENQAYDCTDCPSGQYTWKYGQSNESDCYTCSKGYYAYSSERGNNHAHDRSIKDYGLMEELCTRCPIGKYNNKETNPNYDCILESFSTYLVDDSIMTNHNGSNINNQNIKNCTWKKQNIRASFRKVYSSNQTSYSFTGIFKARCIVGEYVSYRKQISKVYNDKDYKYYPCIPCPSGKYGYCENGSHRYVKKLTDNSHTIDFNNFSSQEQPVVCIGGNSHNKCGKCEGRYVPWYGLFTNILEDQSQTSVYRSIQCGPCPDGKYSIEEESGMLGYRILPENEQQYISKKKIGSHLLYSHCVSCPDGTYSQKHLSTCMRPPYGHKINSNKTGIIKCENGKYSFNGEVCNMDCPPNMEPNTNTIGCQYCNIGMWNPIDQRTEAGGGNQCKSCDILGINYSSYNYLQHDGACNHKFIQLNLNNSTKNQLYAIGVEYDEGQPIIYGTVFPQQFLINPNISKQHLSSIYLEEEEINHILDSNINKKNNNSKLTLSYFVYKIIGYNEYTDNSLYWTGENNLRKSPTTLQYTPVSNNADTRNDYHHIYHTDLNTMTIPQAKHRCKIYESCIGFWAYKKAYQFLGSEGHTNFDPVYEIVYYDNFLSIIRKNSDGNILDGYSNTATGITTTGNVEVGSSDGNGKFYMNNRDPNWKKYILNQIHYSKLYKIKYTHVGDGGGYNMTLDLSTGIYLKNSRMPPPLRTGGNTGDLSNIVANTGGMEIKFSYICRNTLNYSLSNYNKHIIYISKIGDFMNDYGVRKTDINNITKCKNTCAYMKYDIRSPCYGILYDYNNDVEQELTETLTLPCYLIQNNTDGWKSKGIEATDIIKNLDSSRQTSETEKIFSDYSGEIKMIFQEIINTEETCKEPYKNIQLNDGEININNNDSTSHSIAIVSNNGSNITWEGYIYTWESVDRRYNKNNSSHAIYITGIKNNNTFTKWINLDTTPAKELELLHDGTPKNNMYEWIINNDTFSTKSIWKNVLNAPFGIVINPNVDKNILTVIKKDSSCTKCPPNTYTKHPKSKNKTYCYDSLENYRLHKRFHQPIIPGTILCEVGTYIDRNNNKIIEQNAGEEMCDVFHFGPNWEEPLESSKFGLQCPPTSGVGSDKGTYLDLLEEECVDCPKGKYKYLWDMKECSDCDKGTYQNSVGQQNCIVCEIGKYINVLASFSCSTCDSLYPGKNKTTIIRGNPCTYCDAGYERNETAIGAITGIPCNPCTAGKYSTGIGTNCTVCPLGQFQTESNKTSCNKCPLGQYQSTVGQTECTSCDLGYETTQMGMTTCTICSLGKYSIIKSGEPSICVKCPSGTYQNTYSQTTCILCPESYHYTYNTYDNLADHESKCTYCPDSSYIDIFSAAASPTVTINDFINGDANGNKLYKKCIKAAPLGFSIKELPYYIQKYDNTDDTTPNISDQINERAQYLGLNEQFKFYKKCKGGYEFHISGNNFISCSQCQKNYYRRGIIGEGRFFNECKPCGNGTYGAISNLDYGSTKCIQCPIGKYMKIIQSEKNICENCPDGKYQDTPGNVVCKLCPAGKYGPTWFIDDRYKCLNCHLGRYIETEGRISVCSPCPFGKYGNKESSEWISGNGATSSTGGSVATADNCIPCDVGKYYLNDRWKRKRGRRDIIDDTVCKLCPNGTVYAGNNYIIHDDNYKLHTPYSHIVPRDDDIEFNPIIPCIPCVNGKYLPSNYESNENNCRSCPSGTYMDITINDFITNKLWENDNLFKKGYWSRQIWPKEGIRGLGCKQCLPGTYMDESKSESNNRADCLSCEIGKYSKDNSSNECILCDNGKYTPTIGSKECISWNNSYININSKFKVLNNTTILKNVPFESIVKLKETPTGTILGNITHYHISRQKIDDYNNIRIMYTIPWIDYKNTDKINGIYKFDITDVGLQYIYIYWRNSILNVDSTISTVVIEDKVSVILHIPEYKLTRMVKISIDRYIDSTEENKEKFHRLSLELCNNSNVLIYHEYTDIIISYNNTKTITYIDSVFAVNKNIKNITELETHIHTLLNDVNLDNYL